MLSKEFKVKDRFGSFTIYHNKAKHIFLVEPKGIINPSLIQIDLAKARAFGKASSVKWTYIVNTENVTFPNPLNLFYLKKIKELPNLKEYIIYAPSVFVRSLSKLTNFIIQPDCILHSQEEFRRFVE